MIDPRRHWRTRTRGQAIVELAVILPLMLLFMATAGDLARLFHSQIVTTNAARAGALEAGRHPTSYVSGAACDANVNRIMCAVVAESSGSLLNVTPADVTVGCIPDPCAEAFGNVVQVTVTTHFSLITPFLGQFFGGQSFDVTGSATAQLAIPPTAVPTGTPGADPASPTPSPTPTGTINPSATPTPTPARDTDPVADAGLLRTGRGLLGLADVGQEEADGLRLHGPVDDDAPVPTHLVLELR